MLLLSYLMTSCFRSLAPLSLLPLPPTPLGTLGPVAAAHLPGHHHLALLALLALAARTGQEEEGSGGEGGGGGSALIMKNCYLLKINIDKTICVLDVMFYEVSL